jgi:hypothetical protein
MARNSNVQRALALVCIEAMSWGFFGCEATVDLEPLSAGCPKGQKACPVQGKTTCVGTDDADFGCSSPSCLSCGTLGLQHAIANCNAAGVCAVASCNIGYRHCTASASDGCETSYLSDNKHCGACNHLCQDEAHAKGACVSGNCTLQCATGFGDCNQTYLDGCEVDLTTDTANCGACRRACDAGRCAAGSCL